VAVASHFIEPCLPSPGEQPPTGPGWVHEIKHDGYRLMARRDPVSVGIRLLTRNRPSAACGLSQIFQVARDSGPRSGQRSLFSRVEPWVGCGIVLQRPMPSLTAPGSAAMKQLEVGDRVKVLNGDEDDEGTVLDVDERTEMVIVYLGRHVGGWAFHRDDLRKVRAH
jgi:hypothetical protein